MIYKIIDFFRELFSMLHWNSRELGSVDFFPVDHRDHINPKG